MTPAPAARKQLGFWTCMALVAGNMIGSGIFLLPASLAPYGWNTIFAWLLTIGGGVCLAIVFAQLARAIPNAGGPYAFTRAAFGDAPAFVVAWSYWICLWVGNGALATGAVSYLSLIFPSINGYPGLPAVLSCLIVWIFTVINMRGLGVAGAVQILTTLLKLLPLVAVIALLGYIFGRDGLSTAMPFVRGDIKLASITSAATLTLWAMLGLESATVPADNVRDPERTIPGATIWGTSLTGLIYLLICTGIVLLVPQTELARSNAPIADFIARAWGENAGQVIALFAAISCLGALNGWILLQGTLPYAMAQSGVFPPWFARTSRAGTPVNAHLVSSTLLSIVVLLNYSKSMAELFTFIVLLSTSAALVMYLVCALAALRLMQSGRMAASPGLIVITIIAAGYSVWTLYGAGAEATGWGLVLLLAGAPVYVLVRRTVPSLAAQQPTQ